MDPMVEWIVEHALRLWALPLLPVLRKPPTGVQP